MSSYFSLDLAGATSLSGVPQVRFTHQKHRPVFVPYDECITNPANIVASIADRGLRLPKKVAESNIFESLVNVVSFPQAAVLDHAGWTSPTYFGQPDGNVFSPPDAERAYAGYPVFPERSTVKGSLGDWHAHVAAPLVGQHIPMFVVMLVAAAPLQAFASSPHALGFELVGGSAPGNAFLLTLGASVLGTADHEPLAFADLDGNIEKHVHASRDTLLLLQDPTDALTGYVKARKLPVMRDILRALAGERITATARRGTRRRHSAFFFANATPLQDLLSHDTNGRLVQERVITMRLEGERTTDVFARVPAGFDNAGDFAATIGVAASRYQGAVWRKFIKRLLRYQRDPKRTGLLPKMVNALVAHFRVQSGVDVKDAAAVAIADSFGLVAAAGAMAQLHGILPKEWRTLEAAMQCYQAYIAGTFRQRTLVNELTRLLIEGHLRIGLTTTKSDAEAADVFLRSWPGYDEVLVREATMDRKVPGWHALLRAEENQIVLDRDKDHLTKKRRLYRVHEGSGKADQTRILVFRMPERVAIDEVWKGDPGEEPEPMPPPRLQSLF